MNKPEEDLDKHQRNSLFILWKKKEPLSIEERGLLWMRGTGASKKLADPINSGYYQSLLNADLNYPNPSFHQIELDLNRTFSELDVEDP